MKKKIIDIFYVKKNPDSIKEIKEPCYEACRIAVLHNPHLVRYIKNFPLHTFKDEIATSCYKIGYTYEQFMYPERFSNHEQCSYLTNNFWRNL